MKPTNALPPLVKYCFEGVALSPELFMDSLFQLTSTVPPSSLQRILISQWVCALRSCSQNPVQ
ncbi:hypothetical protein DsansV1_C35g0229331 [Dioscorea sansibarensis]